MKETPRFLARYNFRVKGREKNSKQRGLGNKQAQRFWTNTKDSNRNQLEETKQATSFQSTERILIVNISPPKLPAPNFIKQTPLGIKSEINPNTVVDFHQWTECNHRNTRAKWYHWPHGPAMCLLNILPKHIYGMQVVPFQYASEVSSKADNILIHKESLNEFRKVKLTLCIISDHNEEKLDQQITKI